MRITRITEAAVRLDGEISNARVSFAGHTVSLVAVHSDVVRNGKPVMGVAFNSIGRYAQGGLLRDRMIPRVLAEDAGNLLDQEGARFDPPAVLACAMRNEKPGGHGDRAAAASAIELAIWDLNGKLADEPAYATIARHYGRVVQSPRVPVYAAGGYYYPRESRSRLVDELNTYVDLGFKAFKMKIGGAVLSEDIARIEAALSVAGDGGKLAVDANGRFELDDALTYARAIAPYGLRWYEEIGDPLDYALNQQVITQYSGAVATGENLFSVQDVANLARYAGMRRGLDIFQMDAGLSYGITEYAKMLEVLESHGFDRQFAFPHGGHLINLHIAVALGLGGCEAYPGVFQPFGGYGPDCVIANGTVAVSDSPGFGLERKPDLHRAIQQFLQ